MILLQNRIASLSWAGNNPLSNAVSLFGLSSIPQLLTQHLSHCFDSETFRGKPEEPADPMNLVTSVSIIFPGLTCEGDLVSLFRNMTISSSR